jgi:hypothetical protein
MKKDDGFKDKYSFIDDVGGVMPYVLVSLFHFFGALFALKGDVNSFWYQAEMLGFPEFKINLFFISSIFTFLSLKLIKNNYIHRAVLLVFSIFYLILAAVIFYQIKFDRNYTFAPSIIKNTILLNTNLALLFPFLIAMVGFIKIRKFTEDN